MSDAFARWRLAGADQIRRQGRVVKVAHDPGDPQITSHCPFCGSGQIVGRSDGTIGCDFCGMNYIVRVQPAFPGMPQAPGMGGAPTDIGPEMMDPGMEGEVGPDGMPIDPGMDPAAEGGGFPPEDGDEGGFPPDEDAGAEGDEGGFPPDDGGDEEGGGDAPPKSKKPDKGGKSDKKDKGKKEGARRLTDAEREYTGHYDRGWRSSQNASNSTNYDYSPLEAADIRDEPDAWSDGYLDYATDRPKYHSRECPVKDHERDPRCSLVGHQRQASFTTVGGAQLGEDDYIKHLAVLHSGGHPAILARLRAEATVGSATPEQMSRHLAAHHGWDAKAMSRMDAQGLQDEHDQEHGYPGSGARGRPNFPFPHDHKGVRPVVTGAGR